MLHENPSMLDIDVNHWRNLQALLLDSAKAKRRIVVIHEGGDVLKCVHSRRAPVVGAPATIDDPHAVAERLYRANAGSVDFVVIFERGAFAEWVRRFQDAWSADEDLDVFVRRQYALMDEYPDGIVTYPGRARDTLGLQWRLGTTYDEVVGAIRAIVPPETTVVFGVFEGEALWATLVLRFDADRRVDVVTTVDPSVLSLTGGRAAVAREVTDWVERTYGPCSIALFTGLESARAFLATRDKAAAIDDIRTKGDLIAERVPGVLAALS